MKRQTLLLSLGLFTCAIALTACGDDPSSSLTSQDVACMKIQTAGGSCAGSSSSSTVTSTVTLTNSVTATATSVTTVTTVNTSS